MHNRVSSILLVLSSLVLLSSLFCSVNAIYTVDNHTLGVYDLTYPHHRFILFNDNITWVFWLNDTAPPGTFKYASTVDNFASVSQIGSASNYFTTAEASLFDVVNNGSHVAWVFANGSGAYFWFQRGTLNDDGSITWLSDPQISNLGATTGLWYYPTVTIMDNDSEAVGYQRIIGLNKYLQVAMNTVSNGSFIGKASYTLTIGNAPHSFTGCVLTLNGNKLMFAFNTNESANAMQEVMWEGSSWNTTTVNCTGTDWTFMEQDDIKVNGDYVMVSYINYTLNLGGPPSGDLCFNSYSGSEATGWNKPVRLGKPDTSIVTSYWGSNICINNSASLQNESWVFYCNYTFYGQATRWYYCHRFENDTWQYAISCENFTSSTGTAIIVNMHVYDWPIGANGSIAWLVQSNQTSPYGIYFDYLINGWSTGQAAQSWHNVSAWQNQLITGSWRYISAWLVQLNVRGWHTIAGWLEQLGPYDNSQDLAFALAIGLILIPMLLLIVAAVRRKR